MAGVDTPTTEQQQVQDEEAAFLDGFGGDGPVELPMPETDEDESPTDESNQPSGTTEPVTDASPQPEPTLEQKIDQRFASFNDTFKREIDRAFGKMGGLERTLGELRQSSTRPGAFVGELTNDDLKELADEYPDVAELVRKGLNSGLKRMFAHAPPSVATPTESRPSASPEPVATQFMTKEDFSAWKQQESERITAEVDQKNAVRFMEYLKPDWKTVVGGAQENTAYRQWLANQPADYQQTLANTWNPVELHRSIQQFEKYQAQQKPPSKEPAPKPKPKPNLFRAAVPVKGTGKADVSVGQTEDEAFVEGYEQG